MALRPEWLETDFYQVLGIEETASDREIRSAYRRLARTARPDAPRADERFKAIAAAYDVLGDAERRREYDELRRFGPAAFAPADAGFGDGRTRVNMNDLGDLGDPGGLGGLFGDLFGHSRFGSGTTTTTRTPGGTRTSGRRRRTERPGRNLTAAVRLPFAQAVYGTTTSIDCGGSGGMRRPRNVKVRIPAGVDDGQTIRLPGRGEPGDSVTVRVPPGTPPGRVLRVQGRGVPKPDRSGDLLLTIDIDVPASPTPDERDLIEQLAAAATTRPRARWETAP